MTSETRSLKLDTILQPIHQTKQKLEMPWLLGEGNNVRKGRALDVVPDQGSSSMFEVNLEMKENERLSDSVYRLSELDMLLKHCFRVSTLEIRPWRSGNAHVKSKSSRNFQHLGPGHCSYHTVQVMQDLIRWFLGRKHSPRETALKISHSAAGVGNPWKTYGNP